MENNCGIMGLRDYEIELELGLSIGGNFGKAEKLKPVKKVSEHNNNSVAGLRESVIFDPQPKREIQALRRQEAKKKREEKQQKRGIIVSSRFHRNDEFRRKDNVVDATEERECKKNKVHNFSGKVNPNLSAELNNPLVCPVIPMRVSCPYPQVQFVPLTNGFAYSCINAVPCQGGAAGNEKGVVQQVAVNGRFQPFQTRQDGGLNTVNGYDSEQNSSRVEMNRKTGSNGSPLYGSSLFSDLQSFSNQCGCSSETITDTNHHQLEQPQINCSVASDLKGQFGQSATSHQMGSTQSIDRSRKGVEKMPTFKVTELTPSNPKKEPKSESQQDLNSKPVSTNETTNFALTKDTKGSTGKPPKPQTPPAHVDILSLRNMPRVSTTGTGPNGKTINGFLYRYTKSEVSIICVCHGSSFTPAEFVQHAGSCDASHPLRRITVIPSAF